jgi:fatty-acyl-CoA synthase
MLGTMMDVPLTLPPLLARAGRLFPRRAIVSRLPDRSLHRYQYADMHRRALALAEALVRAGVRPGDRVATLMWNHHVHLEAYLGIPCAGAVLHTLNLRLHPDQLSFIANDGGARVLIVDDVLLPAFEAWRSRARFERVLVAPLGGRPVPAGYESYEDFIAGARGDFEPPPIDERDACGMCHTSGTTGAPKGVVYTHRSTVLHCLAIGLVDTVAIGHHDTLLPVVPMFHVNAWGLPYAAVMTGARMVLPGPHLDAVSLLDLFQDEKVTLTAGVPSIWLRILEALDREPSRWSLPPMRMIVGGSAAPEAMIRGFDRHGQTVIHAWGMTETSPVGTVSRLKATLDEAGADERYRLRATQGLPVPLVDVRIVGEAGEAPHDGVHMGELQVRGPWVAGAYFGGSEEPDKFTSDGWFRTGDVATIDAQGYVKLTDRTKDLIKSGGEWISSVDLENALMGHPAVSEAAVVAVPHPTWGERPLAVVVAREGATVVPDALRAHLAPLFPKWWLPDGFAVVAEIPKTSAGKFLKSALRARFAAWDPARESEGAPPASKGDGEAPHE